MGLFDKLKKEIKSGAASGKTVKYRGYTFVFVTDEASLPDDVMTLYWMAKYYSNHYDCADLDRREEKYRWILKKLYPLIEAEESEEASEARGMYIKEFQSQEDYDAHIFSEFLRKIRESALSHSELQRRQADGEKVIRHGYLFDWLLQSHMQGDFVMAHFPELIDTVWTLVETEQKGQQAIYPGYWMFVDLRAFWQKKDPNLKFDFSLWKESKKYLKAAWDIYDLAPAYEKSGKKDKMKACLDKLPEFAAMTKEAAEQVKVLDKDELLSRAYAVADGVNHRDAWYEKGRILLSSYLTEAEREEGIALMQQAADAGHPTALADMLELRAQGNDAEAQVELGVSLFEGINNQKLDRKRAVELFTKAARSGSAEAYYHLANAYDTGKGVLPDQDRAMSLLRESCRGGCILAYDALAEKEKERNNHQEALRLYKKIIEFPHNSKNARTIKHAIAQVIQQYLPSRSQFDVDENTLSICALALEYAELDAPIVTAEKLNDLAERAKDNDISAVDKLSLYYELESRGPMAMGTIPGSEIFQKDMPRAMDMRVVYRAFELMRIVINLNRLADGDTFAVYPIALAYRDGGNYEKARAYTDLGIELEIPSVLRFVNSAWDQLGYDEYFAKSCLQKAASMGDKAAKLQMDYEEMLAEHEREQQEYIERVKREQAESRRRRKEIEMDQLERDIDLMLGGIGDTVEEKYIEGRISFTDAALLGAVRKRILDSAE